MFVIGLVLQFLTRRYRAFAYWFLAYAIATAGTGISDFLHLDVHIPYLGTTLLWAAILAARARDEPPAAVVELPEAGQVLRFVPAAAGHGEGITAVTIAGLPAAVPVEIGGVSFAGEER